MSEAPDNVSLAQQLHGLTIRNKVLSDRLMQEINENLSYRELIEIKEDVITQLQARIAELTEQTSAT